ncbi:MAG: 1-deoxy-D-xylulose-5-phosphate reductoisomerase [Fuerstiella sp.]|nr:1-deoxy-D-xylulose-5-phosphate reductoisomerase [Fuerstiella sp.]
MIRNHSDCMRVQGITAFRSRSLLLDQSREFRPRWAVLGDSEARYTTEGFGDTRFLQGMEYADRLVRESDVDTVMSAIVGAAGLSPTWAAVDAGKRVAVANKESLVVAGPIITQRAQETGAQLLPVDSEHSAVFQALQAGRKEDLRRIILTASGGPFRGWTRRQMVDVTPDMALNHPTWKMGRKITVDSATMMNKALEIIEARWLFDIPPQQISVVVHPQSIVHSFVEYQDGSVISQMSPPDMRLPIQYALTFPERIECPGPDTNWTQPMNLDFEPPDLDAFPALQLGFDAAARGGTCGAVLNAANEIAVNRFLDAEIRFDQIPHLCKDILCHHDFDARPSLRGLEAVDAWSRKEAQRWTT